MNSYDVGDLVRLECAFSDDDGAAVDPTTITVKYRRPNGAETTLAYGTDDALVREGDGVYYTDLVADRAGQWAYRFAATGTVTAAAEGLFNVRRSSF